MASEWHSASLVINGVIYDHRLSDQAERAVELRQLDELTIHPLEDYVRIHGVMDGQRKGKKNTTDCVCGHTVLMRMYLGRAL